VAGCFAAMFVTLSRQAPSPLFGDHDRLCTALAGIAPGYHLPRDDWSISAVRGSKRRYYSPTASTDSAAL